MAFLGINQFRWVGLRFVCWFYVGNTQRLTESVFMEKPGIEPATPGLQVIKTFCGFPGYKPVLPGRFKICVGFITRTPKGSLKVVLWRSWESTCDPWFTRQRFIPYTTAASFLVLLFASFRGINKFCWVGLRYVCWFNDWNTKRLTKICFMEKPGIEPATPGLQRIALIHYTTVASFLVLLKKLFLCVSWVLTSSAGLV